MAEGTKGLGCKVHYLNSAGIHLREIKGINVLAEALPAHWLLYASLTCYPKNSSPIEIDALLVTDDRVILLELKDWNGDLVARGDRWVVNDRPRGRSPVALLTEKARKVKGIIANRIPTLAKVYVDLRVVLTGSCNSAKLHPDDQRFTWSLADARSLGDPAAYAGLLEKAIILSVKPCSRVGDFDTVLRNPTLFRASQMNWDGYGISESDLFVHPLGLWAEHGAQQFRDPRIKALLRQWQLDKLPHDLNSPETRRIVAEREARVIGLLREAESSVIADAAILQSSVAPPDEILTDHYEVLGLPPNWTTLRRYVEKNRSSFTLDQRLDTLSTLLGIAAELHRQGVAHRDLAPACVWMTSPTRLALTGFMSAQIAADESVGDWLDLLRGYSAPLPEDLDKTLAGTASERDVYQLAQIAREIVAPDGPAASVALPDGLDAVLAKAGANVPAERYSNAHEFADALGEILSPIEPVIDHSRLDAYEVADIPFLKWSKTGDVDQNERCASYLTRIDDRDCMVKVWTGMRRGQSQALDLAMLAMFEGIARLRLKPQDGLPHFEAASLSSVGPFVVYRRAAGVPLGDCAIDDPARVAKIIAALGQTIDVLHGLGCTHDDLSPANILIDSGQHKDALTIIDLFDLAPPGIGAIRNHAYLPEGWERLTGQQIDRFAVVKIARGLVDEVGTDQFPALDRAISEDMDRTAIETLEPATHSMSASSAFATSAPSIALQASTAACSYACAVA
jgi:tRNA A-37 threonylcarbamoyl transferase component Bud32